MTAVAADQSLGCPRFIALPWGSVGSVILDEFPEVTNAAKVLPPLSHGVEHFIAKRTKLNCQPRWAGSDLQWRHFWRSMPCRRPRRRPITLPSPLIRERAHSHSGQHLQHPCRRRNEWSVVWNSSAGTAGGQARHFRHFSWSSPCQHTGHQAVVRRQGHVVRTQQQRGRMGQELPAV